MNRDLLHALKEWATKKLRVPLIIRGARQVGKSWIIQLFGKSFVSYVEINFEKHKTIKEAFQGDIQIPKLLEKLSLYTGKAIIPGKTLLFLDEIQECPEAIITLRYFKEECPNLHVIAAGSLLEFALEKIGMPVGRVEYLYVFPLSFAEFLEVSGRADLRKKTLNQENYAFLDKTLQDLLQTYMWLGGMPEVVDTWLKYHNVEQCQQIQDRLIMAYQDDFSKYARKNQISHVDKIFTRLPQQFGKKFVYTHVDRDLKAAILKEALQCLEKAGIVHLCHYTSSQSLPLAGGSSEKFFKAFFLDIGLAQRILKFKQQDWMLYPIKPEHLGGFAEQFVAQEFIAYQSQNSKTDLFYWQREAKNSQAEIDFVIGLNGSLIPIEVKSGKAGHLKSLQYYLNTHQNAAYGVKLSECGWAWDGRILQVPLYGIENWLKLSADFALGLS
jgi:predicted AAA+ superfamily ATPase